ncbi:MAG: hypothetical protein AAB434_09495 [Planctomycetota bacterium]
MRRILPLLLLASSVLAEDAAELVRRARVRQEHGNYEGARQLAERALREDPSCVAALEMAFLCQDSGAAVESRLHYISHAPELDLNATRKFLGALASTVIVLPDDLCCGVERAALSPEGDVGRTCGPWRPWEWPWSLTEVNPACGPLRQEAFGSMGRRHAEGLQEVERRLEREGVTDAVCWAWLAACYHHLGDAEGAHRCRARARPVTLDERLACSHAAFRCSDDTSEWWGQREEKLLDDVATLEPDGESEFPGWSSSASKALVARHDIVGLARLADAELDRAPIGGAIDATEAVKAILETWLPDEAVAALRDAPGPAAACLRAHLLDCMLQEDDALTLLEATTRDHPGFVHGWGELSRLADKLGLGAIALDAASQALRGAIEAGRPVDPEWLVVHVKRLTAGGRMNEAVSVVHWATESPVWHRFQRELIRSGPDTPLPAALLLTLGEDLPEGEWPWANWLARLFTNATDAETIALVLDRLRQKGRPDAPWIRWGDFQIRGFRHALLRARVFASRDAWSAAEDHLARRLFCQPTPETDVHELLVRLRFEIEHDEEILALPGAAYLVSLLFDAQLQADEARAWRAKAYSSGFRTPGLLIDMLEDGEPVLDELARLDPVAARFEVAMRSGDPDHVRGFLEEDEAAPWQLSRAHHAIGRLTGVRPDSTASSEQWVSVDAKRGWELLQSSLYLARRGLEGHASWFGPVEFSGMSLDELLEYARPPTLDNTDWLAAIARRAREGGEETLPRILDRPQGPSIAEGLFPKDLPGSPQAHLAVLRSLGERHPQDLRWAWMTARLAARHRMRDKAGEPLSRVLAGRARSARSFDETIEATNEWDIDSVFFAKYLRLQRSDPLSVLMTAFGPPPEKEQLRVEILPALLASSRDDAEKAQVAQLYEGLGLREQAGEILSPLADSADRGVRWTVWRRSHFARPKNPAAAIAMAAEPGWTETQAVELWAWAAAEAAVAGLEDEAMEALHEMWKHGFVSREGTSPYEVATPFVNFGSGRVLPLVDLVSKQLQAPSPPPWLSHVAVAIARFPPDEESRQVVARSHELGAATRAGWRQWAASQPEGPALGACRRFLEGTREGGDAYEAAGVIPNLASLLFECGRPQEAVECLRAWSKRCGPITWHDRRGPNAYTLSDVWGGSPFSPLSAFSDGFLPPSVLVGQALSHGWRPREAHAEFERAIAENWPADVKEGCLRALAAIQLEVVCPDAPPSIEKTSTAPTWGQAPEDLRAELTRKLVPTLLRVMREDRSVEMRQEAYARLQRVHRGCPSTRPDFVDDLLARTEDLSPPAPSDVRRWEALLAGADPSERERVEAKLGGLGMRALPLLRALRGSSDPEAASRAETILEELAAP